MFRAPAQREFIRADVRIVTGDAALAFGPGVAFHRCKILLLMAIKAQRWNAFLHQRLLAGRVRIVASGAILNHIVREFCLLQEVVVAIPDDSAGADFFNSAFLSEACGSWQARQSPSPTG